VRYLYARKLIPVRTARRRLGVNRLGPQERAEALKILYRIRDAWTEREGASPEALEAIENLLVEYERKQGTEGPYGTAT
jgi:hypothetical protein